MHMNFLTEMPPLLSSVHHLKVQRFLFTLLELLKMKMWVLPFSEVTITHHWQEEPRHADHSGTPPLTFEGKCFPLLLSMHVE